MDYRIQIVLEMLQQRFSVSCHRDQIATDHHTNLLLAEMAAEVNLSPSHLAALFNAATQQTFAQCARHLWWQRAAKEVRTTFKRISEIADEFGYEDASHFSRDFKRMIGMTPLEYRRACNEKQEEES